MRRMNEKNASAENPAQGLSVENSEPASSSERPMDAVPVRESGAAKGPVAQELAAETQAKAKPAVQARCSESVEVRGVESSRETDETRPGFLLALLRRLNETGRLRDSLRSAEPSRFADSEPDQSDHVRTLGGIAAASYSAFSAAASDELSASRERVAATCKLQEMRGTLRELTAWVKQEGIETTYEKATSDALVQRREESIGLVEDALRYALALHELASRPSLESLEVVGRADRLPADESDGVATFLGTFNDPKEVAGSPIMAFDGGNGPTPPEDPRSADEAANAAGPSAPRPETSGDPPTVAASLPGTSNGSSVALVTPAEPSSDATSALLVEPRAPDATMPLSPSLGPAVDGYLWWSSSTPEHDVTASSTIPLDPVHGLPLTHMSAMREFVRAFSFDRPGAAPLSFDAYWFCHGLQDALPRLTLRGLGLCLYCGARAKEVLGGPFDALCGGINEELYARLSSTLDGALDQNDAFFCACTVVPFRTTPPLRTSDVVAMHAWMSHDLFYAGFERVTYEYLTRATMGSIGEALVFVSGSVEPAYRARPSKWRARAEALTWEFLEKRPPGFLLIFNALSKFCARVAPFLGKHPDVLSLNREVLRAHTPRAARLGFEAELELRMAFEFFENLFTDETTYALAAQDVVLGRYLSSVAVREREDSPERHLAAHALLRTRLQIEAGLPAAWLKDAALYRVLRGASDDLWDELVLRVRFLGSVPEAREDLRELVSRCEDEVLRLGIEQSRGLGARSGVGRVVGGLHAAAEALVYPDTLSPAVLHALGQAVSRVDPRKMRPGKRTLLLMSPLLSRLKRVNVLLDWCGLGYREWLRDALREETVRGHRHGFPELLGLGRNGVIELYEEAQGLLWELRHTTRENPTSFQLPAGPAQSAPAREPGVLLVFSRSDRGGAPTDLDRARRLREEFALLGVPVLGEDSGVFLPESARPRFDRENFFEDAARALSRGEVAALLALVSPRLRDSENARRLLEMGRRLGVPIALVSLDREYDPALESHGCWIASTPRLASLPALDLRPAKSAKASKSVEARFVAWTFETKLYRWSRLPSLRGTDLASADSLWLERQIQAVPLAAERAKAQMAEAELHVQQILELQRARQESKQSSPPSENVP